MTSLGRYSTNSIRRLISALNSIRFRDDVGEVEYFGQKVVMLRRDAFTLMRKELLRIGGGAGNVILSIAGRRVGTEEGRALLAKAEAVGLELSQSLPDFIRVAVEETNMGYGKAKVDDLHVESARVKVSVANSFEAEPGGRSQKPSCIFTLSYFEGVFSQLIGKDVRGSETTCRGKGDALCRFEFSPRSNHPG